MRHFTNASNKKLLGRSELMRNNLINFRKKLGMNQEEFGSLLNLTKQKVSNLETNRKQGTGEEWIKIQILFNLTPEQTLNLMEVN